MRVDNEFYKSSLDRLYDGVYYVDRNRKIKYWNKAAERLTGYKIGATFAQSNDTMDTLLKRADQLMYHSKLSGRNRVSMNLDA